jgi:hypothetical protein
MSHNPAETMSIIPAGTKFYIPSGVKIPDDSDIGEELEIRNKIWTQLNIFGITFDKSTGTCKTTLHTITHVLDMYTCTVYLSNKTKLFCSVTCDDGTDYVYICK